MHPELDLILKARDLEALNWWKGKYGGLRFYHNRLWGYDFSGLPLEEIRFENCDLTGVNFSGASLNKAYFEKTSVHAAQFVGASLGGAVMAEVRGDRADFTRADLTGAQILASALSHSTFEEAAMAGAYLASSHFRESRFSGAKMERTHLTGSTFPEACFNGADLRDSVMIATGLEGAVFRGAVLRGADLSGARCVKTDFCDATLEGCSVYGISAWDLLLENTVQTNLKVAEIDGNVLTVDNIEVAQFIYMLLNNERIRSILETVTSKVVLILGRFSTEHMETLKTLKKNLQQRGFVPVIFDFQRPTSRNLTETVSTLAHLSSFIVADLSDPRCVPQELERIIPHLKVPVQPVISKGERPYSEFFDLWENQWVLPLQEYSSIADIDAAFTEKIIVSAQKKQNEILEMRQLLRPESL